MIQFQPIDITDNNAERRVRRLRLAMGSWVAIEACGATSALALTGVERAYAALQLVEKLMHPTRVGSDIARINSAAAGQKLQVHPWSYWCLSICQQLHGQSGGHFDPAIPPGRGSISDLRLTSPDQVTVLQRLYLDLGGIAKGFAVDRAVEALIAAQCITGLVNAGGDLRAFGSAAQQVLLRTSATHQHCVSICNQSLAVSDPAASDHPLEYLECYSRRPIALAATGPIAVIAPTAAIADALTKPLRFLNKEQCAQLLERCESNAVEWARAVE
jgi:FAD:protein FMN transferase